MIVIKWLHYEINIYFTSLKHSAGAKRNFIKGYLKEEQY